MVSEGGRRYSGSSGVTWTSVVMVIAGVVSLIGTGIGLRFFASVSKMAAGLWCGSMFIAAGAVGISAGQQKTNSLITAAVVTAAVAIVFAVTQLVAGAVGLDNDLGGYSCSEHSTHCKYGGPYSNCYCETENWKSYAIAANALLVASASVAVGFSCSSFVIGCLWAYASSANRQTSVVSHVTDTLCSNTFYFEPRGTDGHRTKDTNKATKT